MASCNAASTIQQSFAGGANQSGGGGCGGEGGGEEGGGGCSREGCSCHGRAVHLNLCLTASGFLHLSYGEQLSTFASNFNLRRYTAAEAEAEVAEAARLEAVTNATKEAAAAKRAAQQEKAAAAEEAANAKLTVAAAGPAVGQCGLTLG